MAQQGVVLSETGDSVTILNDSGTTAITAGDLLYFPTNDNEFGTTVTTAKAAMADSAIKVKSSNLSASSYLTPGGVALTDIAADGYGTMALRGVFLHRVSDNTEAGESVMQEDKTSLKLRAIKDLGTTVLIDGAGMQDVRVGRALTGGATENQIIAWKLKLQR